jgi:hypothetical protein
MPTSGAPASGLNQCDLGLRGRCLPAGGAARGRGPEVVRRGFLGYPRRVTARTPLDTLKDLRQQVHHGEHSRLLTQAEAERAADAERERARQLLLAATASHEALRKHEDQLLAERGITAAEGQLRAAWEERQRQNVAALWEEHERAVDSHREAVVRHERACQALTRADAELRLVADRIERRKRERERGEELAQQETLDESSLRRFSERNGE